VVASLLPIIELIRRERGASVVLDTRAALAFDGAVDITEVVLGRVRVN
jgi:Skp family chaperone for outer membrane proteins